MKLGTRIAWVMGLILAVSTALFGVVVYNTQKKALIDGLDSKLYTAAFLAKAILPAGYHDTITGPSSVSPDEYLRIVDQWNGLCQALGMEYIWSLLLFEGKIVFTSGSSTSKDVTQGDHALFFEAHSDPQLYEAAFATLEPQFQINDDKWGRIRAVLIPFRDTQGRPYLFGASMRMDEVDALTRQTLWRSLGTSLAILVLGVFLSVLLARSLSRPIETLTSVAKDITKQADSGPLIEGNMPHRVTVTGPTEIRSLSDSINTMSRSIQDSIEELRGTNENLHAEITERERAEEALEESQRLLEDAQEIARVGSYNRDISTNKLSWSNETYRLFGYSPGGVTPSPALVRNHVHPDDREAFEETNDALVSRGKSADIEFRIVRRDGEVRIVRSKSRLEFDTAGKPIRQVGAIQDITERRKAEEALRDSEERYRILVENAPEAVVVLDHDLKHFVEANENAADLFKLSREDLMKTGPIEMSPPIQPDGRPSSEAALEFIEEAIAGGKPSFEWIHRDALGNDIPCEIRLVRFPSTTQKLVRASITDISERKEAEEERFKFEQQVQHAQKLESLGVLAGGIAHDFNNLLMGILGNADLALQDLPSASPARPGIEEIERVARRAAELCNQMLAYSGKGRFELKAVNLSELVQEMTDMLQVAISKKALIRYSFPNHLPAIEADPTQIRQIVMNLIVNASEAIGNHSGVIAVSTGAIQCGRAYLNETQLGEDLPEGLYAYLEVADTGEGMDQETAEKVFDPFFTTKFTGRGLGMAAVLGIVRGHRGTIKIDSKKHEGTTFTVLIPAVETEAESAEADDSTDRDTKQADSGPLIEQADSGTVLLVDDEEVVRSVGSRMLERLGFRALTAEDGREALEIYQKNRQEIVCAIVDLTMPHMDGEECFRELRRLNKDVMVILSSGYDEQEATQRFVGKGLAGFIQKPYQLSVLKGILRSLIHG